jgi:hypothetical protein
LGKHHDVYSAKDRPQKDLGSEYIDAGKKCHYKESRKPYPLKKAA